MVKIHLTDIGHGHVREMYFLDTSRTWKWTTPVQYGPDMKMNNIRTWYNDNIRIEHLTDMTPHGHEITSVSSIFNVRTESWSHETNSGHSVRTWNQLWTDEHIREMTSSHPSAVQRSRPDRVHVLCPDMNSWLCPDMKQTQHGSTNPCTVRLTSGWGTFLKSVRRTWLLTDMKTVHYPDDFDTTHGHHHVRELSIWRPSVVYLTSGCGTPYIRQLWF